MLSDTKFVPLKDLVKHYSREEIIWTSGYLAGILEQHTPQQNTIAVPTNSMKPTIIYGTETGNSKKLALQLQGLLKKNNIQSKSIDAFQYPLEKMDKENFLIIIISTQGEGDLPQNTIPFFDTLNTMSIDLSKTAFAVLGLGDSSYPFFCKAGQEIDTLLERLGAHRAIPLQKADVNYIPIAENWFTKVLKTIQNSGIPTKGAPKELVENTLSHKKNYIGTITHKVILNDRESNKETYHIEIKTNENPIYEPGDAIGFYPKNDPKELTEIAAFFNEEQKSQVLKDKNIRGLSKKSLTALAKVLNVEITDEKADVLTILKKYPKPNTISLDDIVQVLHPVAPRLYSVSSALEAHDDEIHITVNRHTFISDGHQKTGLCSQFLADYPKETPIEFYIHKNQNFKLPDHDKDIIMIGPGTGIAPFRSFLAHRDATGSTGKNWLFFGEQHFVSDFYYQTEIQEWLATGVLTTLDTAFSRDQKHKIYVQDRLKQKAKELYKWIENGAYIYVCGQKKPMSTDIEKTLADIIATEKNISSLEAKNILETLEIEKRYQKDVY